MCAFLFICWAAFVSCFFYFFVLLLGFVGLHVVLSCLALPCLVVSRLLCDLFQLSPFFASGFSVFLSGKVEMTQLSQQGMSPGMGYESQRGSQTQASFVFAIANLQFQPVSLRSAPSVLVCWFEQSLA